MFFVPNGEIAAWATSRWTFRRAVVDIPIGKDADVMASLAAVRDVATELGEEWSGRITQSPQMVGVQNILAVEGPIVRRHRDDGCRRAVRRRPRVAGADLRPATPRRRAVTAGVPRLTSGATS